MIDARVCSPQAFQLCLIRVITCSIVTRAASMSKGGVFSKAPVEKEDTAECEKFLGVSRMFPCVLDLAGTVQTLTDVSSLWFREYYLEMTNQLQFPNASGLLFSLVCDAGCKKFGSMKKSG